MQQKTRCEFTYLIQLQNLMENIDNKI